MSLSHRNDALVEFGASLINFTFSSVTVSGAPSIVIVSRMLPSDTTLVLVEQHGTVLSISQGAECVPLQLLREVGSIRTELFFETFDILLEGQEDASSEASGTTASRRSSQSTTPSDNMRGGIR